MTALVFRPCDYALLWDSASGAMYMLTAPEALQEAHAGAASAIDCPFFTDHANYTGRYDRLPNVVKLESGVFSGAYTFDEADETVCVGRGGVVRSVVRRRPIVGRDRRVRSLRRVGARVGDECGLPMARYVENGAWLLHAMCLIPLSAWAAVLWLTLTHERVHCLNAHRVSEVRNDTWHDA